MREKKICKIKESEHISKTAWLKELSSMTMDEIINKFMSLNRQPTEEEAVVIRDVHERECEASWTEEDEAEERALRERIGEEAWNSRPGVYTDEELDEILREAEESGEWISHEEVIAECEKLWYKDF